MMINDLKAVKESLGRQIMHWYCAMEEYEKFENHASPQSWDQIEQYLGKIIRNILSEELKKLKTKCRLLDDKLKSSGSGEELHFCKEKFLLLKEEILKTEICIDFYGDAIASRTNDKTGALLRGLDFLGIKSLETFLIPLGKAVPPVLTYLDKGLGASILKAGMRLWNKNLINPAALIKIVRHNLPRPTSLIHEAGHQAAYMADWNEELAAALEHTLYPFGDRVARTWADWASEIAADAFAFAFSGYGSVAALHDVLSADNDYVFAIRPFDPHPVCYIRVLLGVRMCEYFYGKRGPWMDLEYTWKNLYPLSPALVNEYEFINALLLPLTEVVETIFVKPVKAFYGKAFNELVNPVDVRPDNLFELEQKAGKSLYTSHYWLTGEALKILALTSYKLALPEAMTQGEVEQQLDWIENLGKLHLPSTNNNQHKGVVYV